jgi:hypothetical protein
MKRPHVFAVVFSLFLAWCGLAAQSTATRTVAVFPGNCLRWVQLAENEIHKKHLNLDDYNVTVDESSELVTVSLKSLDAPAGSKGSAGSHPGFAVEIRKADSKIVKSFYLR